MTLGALSLPHGHVEDQQEGSKVDDITIGDEDGKDDEDGVEFEEIQD